MKQTFAYTGPTPAQSGQLAQFVQVFEGEDGVSVVAARDHDGRTIQVALSTDAARSFTEATTPARAKVWEAINGERDYQDSQKQGDVWRDGKVVEQSPVHFLGYMQIYMGQAAKAHYDGDEQALLHVIRKVTALGVACMEKFGAPKREGF